MPLKEMEESCFLIDDFESFYIDIYEAGFFTHVTKLCLHIKRLASFHNYAVRTFESL